LHSAGNIYAEFIPAALPACCKTNENGIPATGCRFVGFQENLFFSTEPRIRGKEIPL
jgi:hypothetical protein